MHTPDSREEIDFLLETEYALQSQLTRVQERLTVLLDTHVMDEVVERPKHLTLVVSNPPDGVA